MTPCVFEHVSASTNHLFGGLVSSPLGIAVLALAPGICEEILFRGALQPRIGLIATALLFTASHSEYGFSFYLISVLVSALGLGLIRRFTNTTTSATAHVVYNLIGGIGLAGSQVDVAVAIELILLAGAGYAIPANLGARAPPPASLTSRGVEGRKNTLRCPHTSSE